MVVVVVVVMTVVVVAGAMDRCATVPKGSISDPWMAVELTSALRTGEVMLCRDLDGSRCV